MQQTSGQKQKNTFKTRGGIKMFKEMKKRIKNEKGLTLIELLAVIVILAIISAIAIPAIGNIIDNSRAKAEVADAINVMNAANIYFTDNPDAATFVHPGTGYLESTGKITAFTVKKASPNTIDFTAPKAGSVTGKKLADLTGATVSGGGITWPTSTPAPGNPEDSED